MLFEDRREAGQVLARQLGHYAGRGDVIVLALPRGGVPVGFEVAEALRAPLDVFVVRKLGTPGQEELALGAIATGGVRVLNEEVIGAVGIPERTIDAIAARELSELERRELHYRGNRAPAEVAGRIVILADDGLATGSSMRAAVLALRQLGPSRIVVAVPVASASTCERLRGDADEVICTYTPANFFAVGQWYRSFEQTSDEEVRDFLAKASGAPRT